VSDSDRDVPPNWWAKESGWARRLTRRMERVKARQLLRSGRFELADTRQVKGTQGWLTH